MFSVACVRVYCERSVACALWMLWRVQRERSVGNAPQCLLWCTLWRISRQRALRAACPTACALRRTPCHSQHSLAALTRNTHSQHSLATLTRSTHPQRSLAALVAPTCRAHTVANFSAMQARSGGAPACTEPSIPCQCTWLRWRAAAAAVRHETVPNFFVRHARCVAPLWRCTRVHRDPGQLLGGISSVRARRVQLAAHKKTSTLKNYAVAVCRF